MKKEILSKKSIARFLALVLMLASVMTVAAGCGQKDEPKEEPIKETKTLEDYYTEHKDKFPEDELNEMFSESGMEGTVTVEGNSVKMTIDMSEMLGSVELSEDDMTLLSSTFKDAFEGVAGEQLKKSVAEMEADSGIEGISMDIIVTIGEKTVYEESFTK